jgi:hypothetical protein
MEGVGVGRAWCTFAGRSVSSIGDRPALNATARSSTFFNWGPPGPLHERVTAIAATVNGRFVTTSCPGCHAVLMIEFDPPRPHATSTH